MFHFRAIGLLLVLLGACDSTRPTIDPAPYYLACFKTSTNCPSPYECTTETSWHGTGPMDVCLVPCSADDQCPDGYFCMGVTQSTDVGADHHCIKNI